MFLLPCHLHTLLENEDLNQPIISRRSFSSTSKSISRPGCSSDLTAHVPSNLLGCPVICILKGILSSTLAACHFLAPLLLEFGLMAKRTYPLRVGPYGVLAMKVASAVWQPALEHLPPWLIVLPWASVSIPKAYKMGITNLTWPVDSGTDLTSAKITTDTIIPSWYLIYTAKTTDSPHPEWSLHLSGQRALPSSPALIQHLIVKAR